MKVRAFLMTELEEYCKSEFLKTFRKQDIHAIRGMFDEAYMINNKLYSMDTFLKETEIGLKDVRTDNLRAAIAKVAKLYCTKGILPYKYISPPNTLGNCRHIELRFDKKALFLARIEYPSCVPKKTLFRPAMPNMEIDMFTEQEEIRRPINVYTATYGDGGADEFRFGKIGILGEISWLYSYPLVRGAYKYISQSEEEEILVDLAEPNNERDIKNESGE